MGKDIRSIVPEITAAGGLSNTGIEDNWELPTDKIQQYRFQVAVEDYDGDGDSDLLPGNRLDRNDSEDRFIEVTEAAGLQFLNQAMGVQFADYDNDGRIDLYVLYQASADSARPGSKLRWVEEDDYGEENPLWKNIGQGRFRNMTATRLVNQRAVRYQQARVSN